LVNALAYRLNDLPVDKHPLSDGSLRPGLVHRIDKDTSGLLVIAKKESAMTHLARQFFDHSIQRTYQALVWGCPDAQGTIRASIDRDPADRQRMKGYADHRTGKPAVTHYRRLENWGPVSLMEFTLETGRTHQIRVHTSMNGFPIFNDATYGGDALVRGPQRGSYRSFVAQCMRDMPRMALHAKTLGFVHPDTGQNLFFDSELPADFEGVLKAWKTWALQET
ncbi:MAG: RluA family pseudouridine synthase, partial [Bacteroidia bacterium]